MDDVTTQVVVVGAGAAGLLAAVTARRLGLDVIVVEAGDQVGGATALGDGTMWLPANPLAASGSSDSVEEARAYLDAVLGAPGPASTAARRDAFVRTAPLVARWLRTSKIGLSVRKGLPDEDTTAPGAKAQGRCLAVDALDLRLLGDRAAVVRGLGGAKSAGAGLPVIGGLQKLAGRVFGGRPQVPAGGAALVAELLRRADGSGVEIRLNTEFTDLVVEDGTVTGVRVRQDGTDQTIRAERGVLLASGGFEADPELRGDHLPLPTDTAWTTTRTANTGAALRAGLRAGPATAGLDDAWWTPVMIAGGEAHDLEAARSAPHGLIVDQAGDRFFDEAASPVTAGRALYDRNRGMRAVPSFLIVDNRHRQSYRLGPWPPGTTPRSALDDGDIVKAARLDEIAQALGIDRAGLIGTVVAFNGVAGKGSDTDFKRGASPADKARGDAGSRRNPCLGKVEKGPYWAVRVYPGDAGTKGGLVVDENGQVLSGAGAPLPGLFACGGAAASLFPQRYPAPGAALGAALVEAFRASLALSDALVRLDEATS